METDDKNGAKPAQEETIAAISTPLGEGGVGMVRMSGATALDILGRMFRSPAGRPRGSFETHRVYYGHVVDGDGAKIDEVLATAMMSPRTYTREDVVEISCHGGAAPVKKTLQRALELGARIAEPGEFSKRAFLNGRIDLVQAEAIIDLIKSRSEKGWKTAFSQLDGRLSETLSRIEQKLVEIVADLEGSIDFPDEELEIAGDELISKKLQELKERTAKITSTYGLGRIYREGVSVAIAGRPNVGKSSLMNALLERDRVIVTEIPGTTRDTVEETLQIEGVAVKIVDTAGVRATDDPAERLGVERAMEAARGADVVLLTLDGSAELTAEDEELIGRLHEEMDRGAYFSLIPLINKSDKPQALDPDAIQKMTGARPESVSAKTGEGVDALRARITAEVEKHGETMGDGPVLTRERHLEHLREMTESIGRAMETLAAGLGRELIAADLQEAKEALEELTGKAVDDQVIDRIFSEFCIGK